jgi:hypothetical protein
MPGLGRRTFAPGEVLTATNVMGYLQDQAIMNFAGTAARGSAIGTAVSQGMVSFINDTGVFETYYNSFGTANPGGRTGGAGWYPSITRQPIQTVGVYQNSTFTLAAASGTQAYTGVNIAFTPRHASSIIHVTFNLGAVINATNSLTAFTIYKNGSATSAVMNFGTQPFIQNSGALSFIEAPGSTATVTYAIFAGTSAGSITVDDGSLIVTEIGG